MASNINPNNIDGTYPIAGQDNDSQGFRDNFTNIKNNLTYAASEISDLQSKAVLTSALTGGTLVNNMAGAVLKAPKLLGYSETVVDQGLTSGTITLDFSAGNFQKVTPAGSISLAFTNWPTTGTFGSIRFWIALTNTGYTVSLPITTPGVTKNLSQIAGLNTSTGVLTFDTAGDYVLEFSTIDAGTNITINDLSRNASTLQGTSLYYNPSVASTFLIGYGSGLSTALLLEQGQDVISSQGSYNSVAIGNVQQANIAYTQFDSGGIGGYSVTSARGNLAVGNISPTQSGDLLGYVNSIAYTGNITGTGNVFQQISSIGFYATGSNVTYGLGGNIAFFTGPNGDTTLNRVIQAVGVENDQSTKFYGNIITSNVFVPTSSTTAGGVKGQITYDSGYVYVCIGPGNWKRSALSTF